MEPSWVEIKENGAQVEFGGGLHHFGYRLEMALPQAKGELQNTWVLYFYSEASDDRELSRFTLMSDAVLTEPQFEKLKKSANDRRMTK